MKKKKDMLDACLHCTVNARVSCGQDVRDIARNAAVRHCEGRARGRARTSSVSLDGRAVENARSSPPYAPNPQLPAPTWVPPSSKHVACLMLT